jgi:hypothetical protein
VWRGPMVMGALAKLVNGRAFPSSTSQLNLRLFPN